MADIGIMGGTFDPVHNGHLLLAQQAYEEYRLDQIWFMPAGQPPHKQDRRISPVNDRCEMVRLAIAGTGYFVFSDFEAKQTGSSYTARTLKRLQEQYPQHCFFFIIGADSLYEIETWYHPKEVMEKTVLLAAGREYDRAGRSMEDQIAYLTAVYQARIYRLHCAAVDISSGELRKLAAKGERLAQYVPEQVEAYIQAHGLYLT